MSITFEPILREEVEKVFLAQQLRLNFRICKSWAGQNYSAIDGVEEDEKRRRKCEEEIVEIQRSAEALSIDLRDKPFITLVLTDGTIISGPTMGFKLSENSLNLCARDEREHYEHDIPLAEIAGITETAFEQEENGLELDRPSTLATVTAAFKQFVQARGKYFPQMQQQQQQQQQQQRIYFGDTKFTEYTPLYADWEYLSQNDGGITGLGAGPVGSMSWKESPWNRLQKLLKGSLTPIEEVAQQHKFTIAGHVNFLVGDAVQSMNMEDDEWHSFLLTEFRFKPSEVPCAWVLVYFRKSRCLLPHNLWENTSQSITFHGEFIPSSTHTEFGMAKGFVKLRAGGVFPNQ